ncbi:MAG: tyrosine-protein phosphatase [Ruminococcus sp.]|nr:tyrosine-protein phosphatase [Ruminococcus sp.]
MSSIFTSTRNTRPILPDSLRFIRSDALFCPTEDELGWLRYNGVTTVIDLRAEDEVRACPTQLAEAEGFMYRNMPVTGGSYIPKTAADVPQSYVDMLDGQMDAIIGAIMSAQTNVLYFCSAGKDRTGVVSAVLLHKLGYDEDYIIADYMQSAEELRTMLEAYASSGAADLDVITPHPDNIIAVINELQKRSVH